MKVIPHPTFESLIEAVAAELDKPLDSVIPIRVVVPALAFEDNLQIRLADRLGICLGVDLMMPQDFIGVLMGKSNNSGKNLWSTEMLEWRIFSKIRRYEEDSLGMRHPSVRDRFAMSGVIADQFDQYGHFRPRILEDWSGGKAFRVRKESESITAAEVWQRKLWCELNKEIGEAHPTLQLETLRSDKAVLSKIKKDFPKVLVLGTGSVDPLLVDVLSLLNDAGSEVTVRVILPSLDYLGDLHKKKSLPSADTDPEQALIEGGHPLLISMGRHAIGSFLLLGKLDPQYSHWPEPSFNKRAVTGTLLNRLQDDIRSRREPVKQEVESSDISIRMHSCFGPRREMETLRDELLRAFTEIPDLKPEEVHIVAPSLELYAPLVSAVLEQGDHPLKIQLTERPASEKDPVIEGLKALLSISAGKRYEASSLLDLLHLTAVRNALGISDSDDKLERVRSWIRKSGVTRGLGSCDRTGSWAFSQDRLVAGRFLGQIKSAKYPDGTFVLSVSDQLGGEAELNQKFLDWYFELGETFNRWETAAPAGEWAERLLWASRALMGGEDDALLALIPHADFLKNLPSEEEVDAGTIHDWFEGASERSIRRARKTGKITFGAIQHLQNIPCRVLCMVGMQDGAFPGESRVPAWDLLRADPCLWDRNARIDDRQLFLDALLTPKERLIISASNRNVRTMKDIPFSSCVDELLRVVERMGSNEKSLVVHHRLQPFAIEYFKEGGENPMPRSYDKKMATVAKEIKPLSEKIKQPFWNEDWNYDAELPEEIPLRDLVAFWRDPAKGFIKNQGIRLQNDQLHDNELDHAPITMGPLESWAAKEAVLNGIIAGQDDLSELLEAQLKADRGLPVEQLGKCYFDALLTLNLPLAEEIKNRRGEMLPLSVELDDPAVIVVGEARKVKEGGELLAYGIGGMSSPKHFMDSWMTSLLAVAQGDIGSTLLFTEKKPTEPQRISPMVTQDEARELLKLLVRGYLEGRKKPLYFAPSTSEKMMQGKDFQGAWEKIFGDAPGEGESEAAKIAWRDRDPFEDKDLWAPWFPISREISRWREVKKTK